MICYPQPKHLLAARVSRASHAESSGQPCAAPPVIVSAAVINVNDLSAAFAGHLFQRVIDGRIRFHRLHFVERKYSRRSFEERKIPADVLNGEVIRVEKYKFSIRAPAGWRAILSSAAWP